MTELQGWLITSARLGLLAFLTLIVIPFMAGLYLDLVMLPFRQAYCLTCCESLRAGRCLIGQGLCLSGRVFVCSPLPCNSLCICVHQFDRLPTAFRVWRCLLRCMQQHICVKTRLRNTNRAHLFLRRAFYFSKVSYKPSLCGCFEKTMYCFVKSINELVHGHGDDEYMQLACHRSTSAHGFDAGYVGLSLLSFLSTRIGRVVCCSPRFVTR